MRMCICGSIPPPIAIHGAPAGKCMVKVWKATLKGLCLGGLFSPCNKVNHLLRDGRRRKVVSNSISRTQKYFKLVFIFQFTCC